MRSKFYVKTKKFVLMMLRKLTRPMALKLRIAAKVYYWSDLRLLGMERIYVLPDNVYRCLAWLCNAIVSINTADVADTVGYYRLRCKWLQRAVGWLIHRIPAENRFA